MSVAFRRDSDEEHLEPRFALPIPPGPNLVTPRGLALIEAKVAAFETQMATIAEADRAAAVRDLRYWRTRLATAEPAPRPADGIAGIGTRVTIRLAGRERTFAIVGHDEADPDAGLIAFSAPLARALIGLEAGESADFGGKPDALDLIAVERLQ